MRKFFSYLFFLLFVGFSAGLVNCGEGTETGNPTTGAQEEDPAGIQKGGVLDGTVEDESTTTADGDEEADVASPNAKNFLETTCETISGCYLHFNADQCQEDLNTDQNVLAGFGADITVYESFDEVQATIDSGGLAVSAEEFNTCTNAIEAVSCQDVEDAGAYDEDQSDDFSNVYEVIPDEC